MKNTNTNLGLILIAVLTIAPFSFVLAKDNLPITTDIGITTSTQANIETDSKNMNLNTDNSVHNNSSMNLDEKTNTENQSGNANNKNDQLDNTEKNDGHAAQDKEVSMSTTYRTTVSFVKNLLQVADKESSIGAQVKIIAQDQNDSNEATSTALTRVETRGKFRTFLFGTDYKSINILKKESVKIDAHIKELKALAEKTTNTTDKAMLEAQIQVLAAEQVKLNNFIVSHEASFSLFGWLANKGNE
jgi:hypothetical protein